MNNEEDFRKYVMRLASGNGHHVSHIEAHQSAAGVPDLVIFPKAVSFVRPDLWLELKVIKDGQIKMRPTQKRWHRERNEAGGRSWVAVLDRATGDILVLSGHVAAGLDSRAASWRGHAELSNILHGDGWLAQLVDYNERIYASNGNGTKEDTRTAPAPLPQGGEDVGGHHWLTGKP